MKRVLAAVALLAALPATTACRERAAPAPAAPAPGVGSLRWRGSPEAPDAAEAEADVAAVLSAPDQGPPGSRHPEARAAWLALRALAGDVPAVVRGLRDPAPSVRRRAARWLGDLPGAPSEALRGALVDPDPGVAGPLLGALAGRDAPGLGPAAWRAAVSDLDDAGLGDACVGALAEPPAGALTRALVDRLGAEARAPAPCVALLGRSLPEDALDGWIRQLSPERRPVAAAPWLARAPGTVPSDPLEAIAPGRASWRLAVVRAAAAAGRAEVAAAWALGPGGETSSALLSALLPLAGHPDVQAVADRAAAASDAEVQCAAARLVDRGRGWPGDVDARCAGAPPALRTVWNAEAVASGTGAPVERAAWTARALSGTSSPWARGAVRAAVVGAPWAGELPPEDPSGARQAAPDAVPPGLAPRPLVGARVPLTTTAGPMAVETRAGLHAATAHAWLERLREGVFDGASFRWDDALGGYRLGAPWEPSEKDPRASIELALDRGAYAPGAVLALPGATGFAILAEPRPELAGRLIVVGDLGDPTAVLRLRPSDVLLPAN